MVNGMTNNTLLQSYQPSSQLGISQSFDGDSFGFMTSLVSNSPNLNSTLTVTADKRLDGTLVQCRGISAIQEVTIIIISKSSLHSQDIRLSCILT